LVVWNMNFIFHFIYGMSSFPLTFIFFKMVETTNQIRSHLSSHLVINGYDDGIIDHSKWWFRITMMFFFFSIYTFNIWLKHVETTNQIFINHYESLLTMEIPVGNPHFGVGPSLPGGPGRDLVKTGQILGSNATKLVEFS
jgi:hypothetical protein